MWLNTGHKTLLRQSLIIKTRTYYLRLYICMKFRLMKEYETLYQATNLHHFWCNSLFKISYYMFISKQIQNLTWNRNLIYLTSVYIGTKNWADCMSVTILMFVKSQVYKLIKSKVAVLLFFYFVLIHICMII